MLKRKVLLICAAVLLVAATAWGQRPVKAPVVAVAIESTDARVQHWAPELRTQAASVVEKVLPKARVISIATSGAQAAEDARHRSADYLVTIDVSPRPYAEMEFGGRRDAPLGGQPANERADAQGAIYLQWTVVSLTGKQLKLHDGRLVRREEYPLGPELDWLRAICSRSVRDAAVAAGKKLGKKAGI